jgi:hypothetical protein
VLEQTVGYDVNKVLKFIGSKPPEFFDKIRCSCEAQLKMAGSFAPAKSVS